MNSKAMGQKLKTYRAKAGLSLEQCSEKIGISTRYLADIERGDKVPRLETFLTILNALGAPADDVLQDSLVVGYAAKSNDLLRQLGALSPARKKQALDIFEGVVASLQQN